MSLERLTPTLTEVAHGYWQRLLEQHDCQLFHSHKGDILQAFALSDFIAEQSIRQPQFLESLLHNVVVQDEVDYGQQLQLLLQQADDESSLHRVLRQFRQVQMMTIAWQDLLNQQDIEVSLHKVSALANALINGAYHWLYSDHCNKHGTPQGPQGPQPMLIIGMGKLGGDELNFSSDIDLIFTFPELGETEGGRKPVEHQQFFTRLGQRLITALNQITVDGQVFRVDMRLRPFGESGPLVMHFAAFEDYYQSQGRDWERYAMVKARIINADGVYSQEVQQILKPFVFRRYLDYGAIDALRTMKRMISQEVRRRRLSGNIKLGAGGIREVEFIAQSFQLIRGGREPALQQPGLLMILEQLSLLGMLSEDESLMLKKHYLFLRKLEHCLQQFNDQQTQQLPDDPIDQQRLVHVMQAKDYQQLTVKINQAMVDIHQQFSLLIGEEQDNQDNQQWPELAELWQANVDEEEAVALLSPWVEGELATQIANQIRDFSEVIHKRGMGNKGLLALDKLMPQLLGLSLDKGCQRGSALLARLFQVISAIYRRTAYLDLLNENPAVLQQLVRLCDASPWIAEQISRFPILLDELLNPVQLYQTTPLDEYYSELRRFMLRTPEDDLELQMEMLRQFKLGQQLHIAAADVTGVLPVMKVSDHLTYLAEALIRQVVHMAWQQMVDKYGEPAGGEQGQQQFAVIGYGKLGGIELGYGSDLDLVFLHGCDSNDDTRGPKAIESRQFYLKLAQRIMHLFNTKTASGQLYEVDMRLRPSGNSGLLVCHIKGFAEYQQTEAWTWEHQALVRSRFVMGDSHLAEQFQGIRTDILSRQREIEQLRKDVRSMREKMRDHLSQGNADSFDIKQDAGGIADIEFLVQFWVLAYSRQYPALALWSDNVRILETLAKLGVVDDDTCLALTKIYLDYRNLSHRLALQQQKVLTHSDEFTAQRQLVQKIWQQVMLEDA